MAPARPSAALTNRRRRGAKGRGSAATPRPLAPIGGGGGRLPEGVFANERPRPLQGAGRGAAARGAGGIAGSAQAGAALLAAGRWVPERGGVRAAPQNGSLCDRANGTLGGGGPRPSPLAEPPRLTAAWPVGCFTRAAPLGFAAVSMATPLPGGSRGHTVPSGGWTGPRENTDTGQRPSVTAAPPGRR